MTHKTAAELEAGMHGVLDAPGDEGPVRLVVRRPGGGEREILDEGQLDTERGLVGDDWINRPGLNSDKPSPYAQVTVMNARYSRAHRGRPEPSAWALCGDQLYVDLDISEANLPAGTRLGVGEAVLEIQAEPHTGCAQFSAWCGSEALRFTSTEQGRALRLRGANTASVGRCSRASPVRLYRVQRRASCEPRRRCHLTSLRPYVQPGPGGPCHGPGASGGDARWPRATPIQATVIREPSPTRSAAATTRSSASAPATTDSATRPRTSATSTSCPTRAASPTGAARAARPARRRRTSWAVS